MTLALPAFHLLKPGQKALAVAVAVFLFLGIYAKIVHQPAAKKINTYKNQVKRVQTQLEELKTKTPQDVALAQRTEALKADKQELSEKIASLEKKIPSRASLSQLVGEITGLAKEVKLESVKQKIVKDQGYEKVMLEVKFYSNYVDAVRYLAALESISPFLKVLEMEILEPKGKNVELGGSPVRLLLSCLLTDVSASGPLKGSGLPKLDLTRDILTSTGRPSPLLQSSKFNLKGITYNATRPSAIINNDVYVSGDKISGYTVKEIQPNAVVLTDGSREHLISLNEETNEENTEKKSET